MFVGVVVIAIALTSWRDVVFVITSGAGDSRTPSAFAVWWLQWMGWAVVALGALAIATATTSRRDQTRGLPQHSAAKLLTN